MRQFFTNEKGERTAVLLPMNEYRDLIATAEELEDIALYDEAKAREERGEAEFVPWDSVRNSVGGGETIGEV